MKNNCFEGLNVIFITFFINFWRTKLKSFSGKANQSLQNGSIWNFARGSVSGIGFEATFKSKTNVLSVWKGIFFSSHFSVNKLKMFLGEARESIKNCVNQRSDIENILENDFETILRSKADALLNLWKRQFSFFLHICEPLSWNRLLWKQGNVFKILWIQIGHGKHFRKWFRSHPVKPECYEPSERTFLRFLLIFEWQSWNHFWESEAKLLKVFKSKFVNKELLRTSMGIVFV